MTHLARITLSVFIFATALSVGHGGIMDKFKKDKDDPNTVSMKDDIKKSEGKGAGGLRYSVSVTDIEKSYTFVVKWDLADAFKLMLTDALHSSGHFIVLGEESMREAAMREQDLAASGRTAGGKKAPKIGRMTPAQLLVRGAVTHAQADVSGAGGGIGFKGLKVGGSGGTAEINITIYLMDSETGQVKASQKITGQSKKRGLSLGYSGSKLGGLTGDFAGFKKDNMGKAMEHAVAQSIEYLTEQLEGIQWEGSVMMAKADTIICNRGSREGVEVGMKFTVGEIEELIDPDSGETLDSEMTKVGELEVSKVKEKICYCTASSGGDKIKKGMTIFLAE
jgi:curli biogenesis system outer membrane secretion channel CsgG